MQLLDLFDHSLLGRRHEVGLEFDAGAGEALRTLTFGEIDERSSALAVALERRGVRAGDRLALYLPNRIEFITLFVACVRLGVIVVPINVLYREREVSHIVGDAAPVAVVTADAAGDASVPPGSTIWRILDLVQESETLRLAPGPRATEGPVRPEVTAGSIARVRRAIDGDAPAAIVYTSGTTGRAKGAVLSHNNFMANATALATCWEITSADRYLAVLPLFHVHGLGNGVVTWLLTGCRMRLVERFEAARAPAWFASFRPTLFYGVPTVYVRLLEHDDATCRAMGAGMRLFVCGSAPLPSATLDAFRARVGHVILERYGMSETLMNAGNPYHGERRPGSVGFPFPGVSTAIRCPDGTEAAVDEVGELLVRGPNVIRGYWRRPDADREAFVDGWFRTGDLASRAADGYLTLHGRRSDLIISGGFNIYPREIEDLLLECPGVREAAVVGVADERRGEVPVAYVVTDDDGAIAALEAACRAQLASFKLPRAFVRVPALPRTALGKVQKHLLPPWHADSDLPDSSPAGPLAPPPTPATPGS